MGKGTLVAASFVISLTLSFHAISNQVVMSFDVFNCASSYMIFQILGEFVLDLKCGKMHTFGPFYFETFQSHA